MKIYEQSLVKSNKNENKSKTITKKLKYLGNATSRVIISNKIEVKIVCVIELNSFIVIEFRPLFLDHLLYYS